MEAPAASTAKIRIYGPRTRIDDAGPGVVSVNTTSKSQEEWSLGLSPFFLGPVALWDSYKASNVENAWQYCKVYRQHLNADGSPSDKWWEWAKEGWQNAAAVRFPMGRGAKPEYSYWNGRRLGYVPARKEIYAPLYASAVVKTTAFQRLKYLYHTAKEIHLWDFDGYDYSSLGMTLNDVINEPRKKMGHAFVLAMLLTNQLCWDASPELREALAQVPIVNPPASSFPPPPKKIKAGRRAK